MAPMQTSEGVKTMSALPPKADIGTHSRNVHFVPKAVLESCLRQTQYGECSLRPTDCLPQGDFRAAETHRDPSGDQLQHKLAGVTTIVRHVIGKLDADPPLFCHHPHFKWWRACRKAVPEHRQPVSLGEVEEHCRITALGDDPSCGESGLSRCSSRYCCPIMHCTRSFRYRIKPVPLSESSTGGAEASCSN